MVFLSLSARVEVNVEAFNAVETVGNLTKHRKAPMIISTDAGYRLVYVPAVSGEAVANAYQRALVELSKIMYPSNPPLTEWDMRGEFIKFADNNHLTPELNKLINEYKIKKQSKKGAEEIGDIQRIKHDFEKIAVKQSIVCDVGGFLYTGDIPVKRTSRLYTGYMLPVYDAIDVTAIEAQLHARHMHSETVGRGEEERGAAEERRATQMIYYVEVSSTIYGLSISLDLSGIGRTSLVRVEDVVDRNERLRRVSIATAALQALFLGTGLGAKLSRFTPVKRIVSAVATVTHPTNFTVSPAQIKSYVQDTVNRAHSYGEMLRKIGVTPEIKVLVYGETPKKPGEIEIIETRDPEEFLSKLIDKALELCNKYC